MDGDGCFAIFKGNNTYRLYIGFTNKYRPLIHRAIDMFGGNLQVQKSRVDSAGYTSNELYHWRLHGSNSSRSFLSAILPYIKEKKSQALMALSYLDLNGEVNPEAREDLFQSMRSAKRSGCVTTETPDVFGSNTDNAYMAGVMDAEGHITINRGRRKNTTSYNARIGITNSYKPVLEMAKAMFGGSICSAGNKKGKPLFIWYLSDKSSIEKCLLHLLPYLIVKKERAKALVEFARLHRTDPKELRIDLYERMKVLNNPTTKIQPELTGDRKSAPLETAAA